MSCDRPVELATMAALRYDAQLNLPYTTISVIRKKWPVEGVPVDEAVQFPLPRAYNVTTLLSVGALYGDWKATRSRALALFLTAKKVPSWQNPIINTKSVREI